MNENNETTWDEMREIVDLSNNNDPRFEDFVLERLPRMSANYLQIVVDCIFLKPVPENLPFYKAVVSRVAEFPDGTLSKAGWTLRPLLRLDILTQLVNDLEQSAPKI